MAAHPSGSASAGADVQEGSISLDGLQHERSALGGTELIRPSGQGNGEHESGLGPAGGIVVAGANLKGAAICVDGFGIQADALHLNDV